VKHVSLFLRRIYEVKGFKKRDEVTEDVTV
jgi:hypothetical protein